MAGGDLGAPVKRACASAADVVMVMTGPFGSGFKPYTAHGTRAILRGNAPSSRYEIRPESWRPSVGNHVIYDRLWESDKLAKCSMAAALAYPWIFLIADDHGRFEYRPARIWAKVFGGRKDVTADDVARWLREYAREGLLIRYHMDGDLAYWYKFKGRKPSERRPSEYPDPVDFPPFTEIDLQGAEKRGSGGDEARVEPRQIDARDRADIEQSRAETERSLAASAAPPLVAEIVREPTWNQRACGHWERFQGAVSKAHGARITNALRPLEAEHGWPVVEPLWIEALEEAAGWGDPGRFTPEVFARSFTARLRQKRGDVRAPPNPKAQARQDSAVAGITGGLRGDRRRLGQGNDAPRSELAGPGSDAGNGEGAR